MAGLIVFEENIEHEARTAIDKTSLPFIKKFSRTAQIYSFTTENLAGYAQALPFKGAGVLTVSGSGDQIIAAYMNGATEVTGFDINLLSGLFSELKLAAMLGLSFEDFKGFLLKEESKGTNPRALDFDVYTHLRSKLSPLSSQFFDRMYEMFGKNGAELRQSKLFNNRYGTNQLKIRSCGYLKSEEDYEKAKEGVTGKTTRWIWTPAEGLAARIKQSEKYGVIMLSNIADYLGFDPIMLDRFVDDVIAPLAQHFTSEGVLCAAYLYNVGHSSHGCIDFPNIRKAALGKLGLKYSELTVPGVAEGVNDAVIMLGGG